MFTVHFELNELVRDVDIGCAPEEHGALQPVLISMRVALSSEAVFRGDTKAPPYDYCHMVEAIDEAIAAQPRFVLQETLFLQIAARVLAHSLVASLDLSLAKTQRYAGCRSMGMQARVTKADLPTIHAHLAQGEV